MHDADSRVFWWATYLTPAIWILLGLGAVLTFSFQWLPLVAMGIIMPGANLVGYWKCERDAKQKIQTFIAQRL